MFKKIRKRTLVTALIAVVGIATIASPVIQANATAGYGLSMSPMNEKILLNPGDSYTSTFTLYAPTEYDTASKYSLEIAGYYTNEENGDKFEDCGSYCEIANWIEINSPTVGILNPGETADIVYTVNVPYDAAGGGQYASILATISGQTGDEQQTETDASEDDSNSVKSTLTEKMQMSYIIYAEITGDTIHQGEVIETNVPSFILDGKISGTSTIKNTGNVHSSATYKLQVFPLFSDEEIYTNEEDPQSRLILPDRALVNNTVWENTPSVGIFNVKYTVEFEGEVTTVEKMVIKCPIWLLFVIIFAIVAIIIWIVLKSKSRKKSK